MRYLRYLFTVLLVILAGYLIYTKFKGYSYDIPQLFREANKALLVVLLFLQFFAYFCNALLSKILVKISGFVISIKNAVSISVLSLLGGQVAPIFGSIATVFYFYKKMKLPSSAVLFLVTSWNMFVIAAHIFFFLVSLIFIPSNYFHIIPRQVTITALIMVLGLLIFGYFLMKNRGKGLFFLLHNLNRILNKIVKTFRDKPLIHEDGPKQFVEEFYVSLELLWQNKRQVPKMLLTTVLFYLANIATIYFSFVVFGTWPDPLIIIFGYTVAMILSIFSLMPETPGIMEASLILVFVNLGFPSHIALFASLLYRFFAYWLPLPLGVASYFRLKKDS